MSATAQSKYFLSMPIFGVKVNQESGKLRVALSSIINYGDDIGGERIKFINKDGEQVQSIHAFPSSIVAYKIDQLDLDDLLFYWKRAKNCYLPIKLDETVEVGEVFKSDFSPVSVMIERREDCTAIKLLFND